MTYRPAGVIPAVATPFSADESLDPATFETLVGLLVDAGVDGLFVCGSQGEFYALSAAEHEAIAARAVVVAETVPVLAGVGSIATRDAVALARRLESTGVAALTVLPPSIIKLDQREIRTHLEAVADAVSVPVVIYDHPARTGNGLTIETVLALAQHPRIVGLKDSAGDIARTAELVARRPAQFSVLMGNDALIAAALRAGADGAVASTASVAPELAVGIYRAVQAGDEDRADQLQQQLLPLREAFALGSFPVVVKRAIALRGLDAGPTRAPVAELSAANDDRLRAVIDGLGLESWVAA